MSIRHEMPLRPSMPSPAAKSHSNFSASLAAAATAAAIDNNGTSASAADPAMSLNDLNEEERSAATLLQHETQAFVPISFINQSHYGTLLRNNALDGRLAQQIEAYRKLSAA
jgi:hypothetical protein